MYRQPNLRLITAIDFSPSASRHGSKSQMETTKRVKRAECMKQNWNTWIPKNKTGAPDSAENCIFSKERKDNATGEATARVCEHESIHTQFSDAVTAATGVEVGGSRWMNNRADIALQEAFCAAFCPTRCLLHNSPQSTSKLSWYAWIQRFFYIFFLIILRTCLPQLIGFNSTVMAFISGIAFSPVSSHSPKTWTFGWRV